MGNDGWERGKVTLPRGEVARVKKALRYAGNAHQEAVVRLVRSVYNEIASTTNDPDRFGELLAEINEEHYRPYGNDQRRIWDGSLPDHLAAAEEAFFSAHAILQHMARVARQQNVPLHLPTVPEVGLLARRYTDRDDDFTCGEASVSFSGDTATWSSGEGKYAVVLARNGWLGRAFFGALSRVHWTNDTGGEIVGNDAYNQLSECADGGANYVTYTCGPAGAHAKRSRATIAAARALLMR